MTIALAVWASLATFMFFGACIDPDDDVLTNKKRAAVVAVFCLTWPVCAVIAAAIVLWRKVSGRGF